ncbi:MAG: Crp/Fnr family transcriptional regulator [Variovorax sp.]|nr:MAG: Crp/Fnr family transcriptional regulator [Variovorax sp.]
MAISQDPLSNRLLATLPEAERTRWLPRLEWVDMPLGQVLYESGSTLSHVYFPTTAIVSLLYVMENGASAEIAVVGNEGIVGMAQTAVCNRHHSLDQQLCRWLLLSLDRLQGDELVMTQELIANMLGVRREGVTEAALKLQQAGLIRYARGHISVLDREGLEKRTCECYAVVKTEYERLLPATTAA